ncbi:hypothetical protein [Castellaniella sp.]|uniref:hypothetical protein n=1 Tax=Castellaniella sp. TaxID=1955812 RepID=UPI0025C07AF1|nr:hypothetical protein [Castellaniella sp.]
MTIPSTQLAQAQLAQASLIGNIGGGVMSAAGSYYGAQEQQGNLEFQSKMSGINADIADTNANTLLTIGNANADAIRTVGDYNAKMAELGAQSALLTGQNQVMQQTLRAGQVAGTQRAVMAARGVDLGEGSAAEVQASTEMMKDIDTHTIQYNAMGQALGYREQGMNAKLQSGVQAMNVQSNAEMGALSQRSQAVGLNATGAMESASAEGISPAGSAAGTLLTSAGKVAQSWYRYQQSSGSGDPLGDFIKKNGWA